MALTQTEMQRMEISENRAPRSVTAAGTRLKVFLRDICQVMIGRAGGKRKALSIRETAALGDRRFVSVIQFEHQRFLIASSPTSISLLSQLPDESVIESGEKK